MSAGRGAMPRAAGRAVLTVVLTVAVIMAGWEAVLGLSGVSPYVAKGPLDVLEHLFHSPSAAANRATIAGNLAITLLDAVVGFAAGLGCALVAAVVFRLSRGIEHALMPVAMLLRSVPLIAMAPVVIMITGRDATVVAVMGAIVVFFPALVSIALGLRSAAPEMIDVVTVNGGSAWTALRLVAFPHSLPAFFAAVRVSVPGAITGALLAEWLATGTGIGSAVQGYLPQARFTELWASVVVVTAVSLLLYGVAQLAETTVLARTGTLRDGGRR